MLRKLLANVRSSEKKNNILVYGSYSNGRNSLSLHNVVHLKCEQSPARWCSEFRNMPPVDLDDKLPFIAPK